MRSITSDVTVDNLAEVAPEGAFSLESDHFSFVNQYPAPRPRLSALPWLFISLTGCLKSNRTPGSLRKFPGFWGLCLGTEDRGPIYFITAHIRAQRISSSSTLLTQLPAKSEHLGCL